MATSVHILPHRSPVFGRGIQLAAKLAVSVPDLPAPSLATTIESFGAHPSRPGHAAEDPIGAAIRRAVGGEPQSRSLTSPDLEHAIRAFAMSERAASTPPERMLAALVTIIAHNTPTDASDWWRAVLRDRIVVWAIEGYYDMEIGR